MAGSVPYYLSEEGDTVDRIVWKHYGRQDAGLVERVLSVNRGTAALGVVLPLGTRIDLPVIKDPKTEESVRLWG